MRSEGPELFFYSLLLHIRTYKIYAKAYLNGRTGLDGVFYLRLGEMSLFYLFFIKLHFYIFSLMVNLVSKL